jgi:hypothetical protein
MRHLSVLIRARLIISKTLPVSRELLLNTKTWSTRLDASTEKKIQHLIEKTGLKEAEVLRRLIIIGIKNVKEPSNLLGI